jgi:RNA polymerase sigma factor (sigma-70 family)
MARERLSDAIRQIQRLFSDGTVSGLSDASLLRQFVSSRDEQAFAALVARHGPMVLSVCRGVLRESRDAEDAFQATFLVLVRRAGSIWIDESLGGWLHRVAYRVALRANAEVARRRKREGNEIKIDEITDRPDEPNDRSIRELHEEIARLPESYRRAVVLCYLEGMTQGQAARELRCGEATLRRRLAGARERLRARLLRGGVSSAVVSSWQEPFRVNLPHLPPSLVESTVQFATRWSWLTGLAAGSGVIPESVAGLAQGVLKTMLLQSVKLSGLAALFAAGVLGTVVLAQQGKDAGGGAGAQPASASGANAQEKPNARVNPNNDQHAAYRALDVDSRTQLIQNRLNQVIDAEFPNGTTFSGLLKHIKQATTDATFPGIPIYVNPVGLGEAGKDVGFPLKVNIKQQAVHVILDNTCLEMGISYIVVDGYLMIDSRTGILEQRVQQIDRKLDQVLDALKRLEKLKYHL